MDKRMSSLELTEQDIKAIANSRAFRRSRKQFSIAIAVGVAILGLYFLAESNVIIIPKVATLVITLVGLVALAVYFWHLDNEQKKERIALLNLWSREISK